MENQDFLAMCWSPQICCLFELRLLDSYGAKIDPLIHFTQFKRRSSKGVVIIYGRGGGGKGGNIEFECKQFEGTS